MTRRTKQEVPQGNPGPKWPAFPMMVEEDGLLWPRTRRVPDPPELIELTRIAIKLGDPRAL